MNLKKITLGISAILAVVSAIVAIQKFQNSK